jgi:hypothetical protein
MFIKVNFGSEINRFANLNSDWLCIRQIISCLPKESDHLYHKVRWQLVEFTVALIKMVDVVQRR